jgi:chromosome segregation ATPase
MAPSRLLSNLRDLRNDIVFLRADIDEGLRRYEILTEGETLSDAHQKELSEILGDINVIAYIHSNMDSLIQTMLTDLPYPNDSQQTKQQKAKRMALLKDSYSLHEGKCHEILSSFETKLKTLNKKLTRVSAATEDWAGANAIRASLSQELELVERGETQLKQRREAIDYYLTNPDKIPQELRAWTVESAEVAKSGNKPNENDRA